MSIQLRVINDGPQTAAFNMAADRYLLDTIRDSTLVVLRLYAWETPTISLGHMQKAEEVLDMAAMKKNGVGWIRRPTGGRAVLHWNDLTYSIVFSVRNSVMGSTVAETYRVISECLVNGLCKAGVNAAPHDSPLNTSLARSQIKLPCFLAPNRDEIMAGGRKLVGSAQKRTVNAVLQHGSIPFTADAYRLSEYTGTSVDDRLAEKQLFRAKCTDIGKCVPALTKEYLSRCLIEGFSETIAAEIIASAWTGEERARIAVLRSAS